ncbi:MAG TPA: hypothetical protein VKB48_01390 [Candidatus Acidoferrum sp.]|nr:hypothetical protein [Candidatus Acidoferrum sp.]
MDGDEKRKRKWKIENLGKPCFGRAEFQSDEEVEGKKERAKEEQEEAPRKTAAGQAADGMKKAGGNHEQSRLRARQVERARGFKAGKIAAQGGEFFLEPQSNFLAATPKIKAAEQKKTIPEKSQKTKSGTGSPIKHGTSPRTERQDRINLRREW